MRGNRKRNTRPELALRSALHREGLRFRLDVRIGSPAFKVVPDLVFPRARVAVFVDGCWWHRCPLHANSPRSNTDYWLPKLARNVDRDRRVNDGLASLEWRVIRVWEHDLDDLPAVVQRVSEALTLAVGPPATRRA
jgi:DNA mismatch endonuclease (patch repair protein)